MIKRAISPVIAIVLLVGISVAAAALAYAWYIGIQKGTQESSGAVGTRTIESATSNLFILNRYYNGSTLNLTVKNIGSSRQTGIKLYIDSAEYENEGDKNIGAGEIGYIWNENVSLDSRVHTVKVISLQGGEGSITF